MAGSTKGSTKGSSRKRSSGSRAGTSSKKTKTSATKIKLPPIQQSEGEPLVSKSQGVPDENQAPPPAVTQSEPAKINQVEEEERHKCPHNRASTGGKGPCTISEYANRYVPHPMEKTEPFKPTHQPVGSGAKLEDATTNRIDYIKHPYEKPYVRPGENYIPPEGDMDGMTNYKKDYTEKPIQPNKPIKRDAGRKVPGKFEGEPTYKNDYRKWSAGRTKPIIRDQGYRPNSAAFEGMPTYQKDYIKHPHALRSSMKPAENAKQSDQPFDDHTGYRDEYIKHPIHARQQKEKPKWNPNNAKLDDLSNYRKDYTEKQAPKPESFKPSGNAYQSNARFEDDTTNRLDYKKWPTSRPYVHEHETYRQPDGDFDHNTTHATDFTKKPIAKTEPVKPQSRPKVPGQFDGTTNYNEDFRKWSAERTRPKPRSDYVPNEAPFEGMPTYQKDYIRHPHALRCSMKPAENAKQSDQPFDDRTGYRDEYIKHPIHARQQKEKPKWNPNQAKLDDLSNYRKDYTEKQAPKPESFKPGGNAYQSNARFEDDTTNRVDYKKWPTSRPYVHEHETYRQPDGDFDHNTTHATDFTKKPIAKTEPVKPQSRPKVPGQFDGTTNYNEDFRKWATERTRPKPRSDYVPNEAPFEGMPTYQRDYTKHSQLPPHSMKPADAGYQSGAPFEDGTEYRQEFLPKQVPPCPAGVIEKGGSTGYTFREQDPTGHKWYEKNAANGVSTSVIDIGSVQQASANNSALNKQLQSLSVAC